MVEDIVGPELAGMEGLTEDFFRMRETWAYL